MKTAQNNIVILGGGESGVGAAILAQKQGFRVLVSDSGALKDNYKSDLNTYGLEWEENGHSFDRVLLPMR